MTAYPVVPRLSVVLDCLDPEGLVPFWAAALGYRHVGEPGSYVVLAPLSGRQGPVFILQRVPEPKSGKNRMHLDLHPPLDPGVPALVERLEALGGRRLGPPVTELFGELGIWWVTMVDPEDNEFDVVADRGHPPPPLAR
jgi:Glyoxalase-like domain